MAVSGSLASMNNIILGLIVNSVAERFWKPCGKMER